MISKRLRVLVAALLLLALGACGGDEPAPAPTAAPTDTPLPTMTFTPVPVPTATPEPTPTHTPVPEPTATPEPTPTDTPEPEPTVETPQVISAGETKSGAVVAGETDVWELRGTPEDSCTITVEPDDDFDAVLDLVGADGASLLGFEVDDSFGTETIAGFRLPATLPFLRVRGFDDSVGSYAVSFSCLATITDQSLTLGQTVAGNVTDAAGEQWVFDAAANDFIDVTVRPEGDFDVVVDLLDPAGLSLLGGELDLYFQTEFTRALRLPVDGRYTIVVRGFEGTTGAYQLQAGLANGGQFGSAVRASDSLDSPTDEHRFPFTGSSGQRVTMVVVPRGNDFDVVLSVHNDDTDALLAEVDASTGLEELAFEVPGDGNYYFQIRGFEGATGTYDIILVGPPDAVLELTRNDAVEGRFGDRSFIEYWLRGENGSTVSFVAGSDAETDIVLEILDLSDNILAEVDDNFSGESETLTFTFTTANPIVIIKVSDFWEGQGIFTLTVNPE